MSLRRTWRRFLGGLSPTHALLLQLLLLALLVANIAGLLLGIHRLRDSYANPVSQLSTRILQSPPPFTLMVASSPEARYSLACLTDEPNKVPCPRVDLPGKFEVPDEGTMQIALLASDFSNYIDASGRSVQMQLGYAPQVSSSPFCALVAPVGLPLPRVAASGEIVSLFVVGDREAEIRVCPGVNATVEASLTFSALEHPDGQVDYTLHASTRRDGDESNPPLRLSVDTRAGGVQVAWTRESFAFTPVDLLSQVFATINISLTLVACCFPWQQNARRKRTFVAQCSNDDGTDKDSGGDDDDEQQPGGDADTHPLHALARPLTHEGQHAGAINSV